MSLPALDTFLHHPGHGVAAAFTLGFVTLSSLQLLFRALNIASFFKERCLRRLGEWIKDGSEERSCEDEEKAGENDENRGEDNDTWLTRLSFEESRGPLPPDPGSLTAILDGAVFIHSLGAFATLVAYFPSSSGQVGCAFVTGWSVLSDGFIRVIGFMHIILSELRWSGRAGTYELAIWFSLLATRVTADLALAAVDAGIVVPLPPPFDSSALCLPKTNRIIGALVTSFDIIFTIALFLRLFISDVRAGRREAIRRRLRWKNLIRRVLIRRYGKLSSLLILAVSAAAGIVTEANLAIRWVPSTLSLLLLLYSFNAPRLPLAVSPSPTPQNITPSRSPLSSQDGRTQPSPASSVQNAHIGVARRSVRLFSVGRRQGDRSRDTDGAHFLQAIQTPMTLSSRPPLVDQQKIALPTPQHHQGSLSRASQDPSVTSGPSFFSRSPTEKSLVFIRGVFKSLGRKTAAQHREDIHPPPLPVNVTPTNPLLPAVRTKDGFFRANPLSIRTDLVPEGQLNTPLGTAYDDGEGGIDTQRNA